MEDMQEIRENEICNLNGNPVPLLHSLSLNFSHPM